MKIQWFEVNRGQAGWIKIIKVIWALIHKLIKWKQGLWWRPLEPFLTAIMAQLTAEGHFEVGFKIWTSKRKTPSRKKRYETHRSLKFSWFWKRWFFDDFFSIISFSQMGQKFENVLIHVHSWLLRWVSKFFHFQMGKNESCVF